MQTSWNLKPLFDGDNDPRIKAAIKEVEVATDKLAAKWQNRTDYVTDPAALLTALQDFEDYERKYPSGGKAHYYFWLRAQQDQTNPDVKAELNKLVDLQARIENKLQFFVLTLGKVEPELQKQFLTDKSLEPYKHFLQKIFENAQYRLSGDKEEILNLKANTSYGLWVDMVEELLSKATKSTTLEDGTKKEVTYEELLSLMSSQQKPVRDKAAQAFNDILVRYVDVAEHELNAILTNKKIDDELRKMPRPDTSRHLSDDIEAEVVDTLLDTVAANNKLAQDYYTLKSKLLGQDKLLYHERNVAYGSIDKSYSFEDAVELVGKVFEALDPEFHTVFKDFIDNGQIDVYPHAGKRGGAFCIYWGADFPTYLSLNYTNKLRDVTTLAHEVGHGIHNTLMRIQPPFYYETSHATAEVASQYLEDFVIEEIASGADEETVLALNMSRLNDDISSIFRQAACYQFEQAVHVAARKKGYLSAEAIGKLFQKYMAGYMGPSVEQSPGSENWWVYWSHIRNFFYNYSYSSGLLIAKAMQAETRSDKQFVGKVKQFLAAGSSASTKEIFARLGIDITSKDFWQAGIDQVKRQLEDTEKLARKLGKL